MRSRSDNSPNHLPGPRVVTLPPVAPHRGGAVHDEEELAARSCPLRTGPARRARSPLRRPCGSVRSCARRAGREHPDLAEVEFGLSRHGREAICGCDPAPRSVRGRRRYHLRIGLRPDEIRDGGAIMTAPDRAPGDSARTDEQVDDRHLGRGPDRPCVGPGVDVDVRRAGRVVVRSLPRGIGRPRCRALRGGSAQERADHQPAPARGPVTVTVSGCLGLSGGAAATRLDMRAGGASR